MHRKIESLPLAYFITLRTYGTWLHGDARGSVDRDHNQYRAPFVPPDLRRFQTARTKMQDGPMVLAADSAAIVETTIGDVCVHRGWHLHIAKARTNHVHIVVGAMLTAERMMNDFKAWATRRLREHQFIAEDQTAWAAHGSTPHLWTERQLLGAIEYVKNWQGGPLQRTWDEVQQELEAKQNP